MARTMLDEADGLTVADVTHSRITVFGGDVTVGELREWFAKESHRMALLADDGRYVASLVPEDIAEDDAAGRPAREVAQPRPTVAPGDPAGRGEELALSTPARRVPVVDEA